MRKKLLFGALLLALAGAGVATAAVLNTITLRSGQCAKLGHTKVCAARAVVRTLTLESPPVTQTQVLTQTQTVTQTVAGAAQTVTRTVTQTVTVGSTPPPPTTTTTAGGGRTTLDFSGDGDKNLAPFSNSVGETLSWTINDTCGFGISIWDEGPTQFEHLAGSTTAGGSTYLAQGTHTISVIACGTWTIHIG